MTNGQLKAFGLGFAPSVIIPRAHTACQASLNLHRTCAGQFAKRIRPFDILGGNGRDVKPVHKESRTAGEYHVMTASLAGSLASFASTGAGIFLLGFIIFVHESGHFLAARLQGIRVKNFSIGFGPKLFSFKTEKSETEFTVRVLPLGGYVAFPEHTIVDEETEEESFDDDPDLLQNRPVLDRAIVISAGVVANIILAWAAIFTSVSSVGVPTYSFNPGVSVANVVDGEGAAAKGGMNSGDIIVKVDGEMVPESLESAGIVAEKIRTSNGKLMKFGMLREKKEFELLIRPTCCNAEGNSALGVQLVPNVNIVRARPSNMMRKIETTNSEFNRLWRQTWKGVVGIFGNFEKSSRQLSGPIGVVSMGADLARNDSGALLTFCAVISINLALINALPLPALDGGQMTFLVIEALRGAPVSLRVQDTINRTALLLFLAFSGVLVFGDLEKLNVFGAIQKLFG